jgi:hypothetical protein
VPQTFVAAWPRVMLIDSRSGDAGDESPILNLHEQTSAPAGLGSPSASTEALGSASGLIPSLRFGDD